MTSQRLNPGYKWVFGLGQSVESLKNYAFGSLLLLYYNQVLGMSGALSGLAVGIALFFDAITDPAVGSWSDGFHHRLGRRHFFMLISILPMGLAFFLVFWPPEGLTELQLFFWLTFFAILCRTALTFYHVPYLALGAEMSPDYQERTQIAAIRQAVGLISSLFVVAMTWQVIMVATPEEPTPQLTREPYFDFAILCAVVMMGTMLASALGTLPLLNRLSRAREDHPKFSLGRVYKDIFDALRNQSFFALFWGSLVFAVFIGVHANLATHTKTFFWSLDTTSIEYMQYAGFVGGLIGLLFIGWSHKMIDKRATLIGGVIVYAAAATIPLVLKLVELMPTDPIVLRWTLVAIQGVGFTGIILAGVTGVSMLGDIADEHELHHGRRQEGIYFGSHNLALKATTALGAFIAGIGLDLVSFPVNSRQGEVSAEVLFNYGAFSIGLIVIVVLSLWIFWPYNMSKQRHDSIREKLALGDGD